MRLTAQHPSPRSPSPPTHTHFIVFTVKWLKPYPLEPMNCSKNRAKFALAKHAGEVAPGVPRHEQGDSAVLRAPWPWTPANSVLCSEEVVQLSIIYRTKGIKNQGRASCYRKQGLTEMDQGAPATPQRPLLITGFPFQVLSQSRSFYR